MKHKTCYFVKRHGAYGKDGLSNVDPHVFCPECGYTIPLKKEDVAFNKAKRTFYNYEFYYKNGITCSDCGCIFTAREIVSKELRRGVKATIFSMIMITIFIILAILACNFTTSSLLQGITIGMPVLFLVVMIGFIASEFDSD